MADDIWRGPYRVPAQSYPIDTGVVRMPPQEGWTCPKCGHVWSPSTPGCFTCNRKSESTP